MNNKPFRPLLAATIENNEQLDALSYPLIASPKVDGIRIICHPSLGPVTRSLKPLRNKCTRDKLNWEYSWGLDGEIVSGPIAASDVFNRTTTAVMTGDGEPEFKYHVFDTISMDANIAYCSRLESVEARVRECHDRYGVDFIRLLPWREVQSPEDVLDCEVEWLASGFEGVMLRSRLGPYKWGRSTLREQTLMKLKRFKDAEAEIIGFEPLERNQNPQTRNIQGLAERSDHKAGKVQVETLGYLRCRDISGGFGEFSIGSGYDANLRLEIWNNRDRFLKRIVTYKFQEIGSIDAPRFPIFLRFREEE